MYVCLDLLSSKNEKFGCAAQSPKPIFLNFDDQKETEKNIVYCSNSLCIRRYVKF